MTLTIDTARFGLLTEVVDDTTYRNAVDRFRENRIALPTFDELARPWTIPAEVQASLAGADPHGPDARNLFRVHWYNAHQGGHQVPLPDHVVIPPELSGVPATIVLALGNRFPMVAAHKVLAAYSCLVPRVVSGQFDPTRHRAIWPSTGNYARGGVAISRIMGCRGVAVLPENMSRERFEWLDRWVPDPADVIRTPGSESNVKEIYDACNELQKDPGNFILNQFSEFANHVGHYEVTGRALGHIFESMAQTRPELRLAAFVSASGSAGTLGAGDRLKETYGARIVAVEALECPTMLYNGFGEHNIQGIGDKHIPLIHNVTNTDLVVGISDHATDGLGLVFNTPAGQAYLQQRFGVSDELVAALPDLGYSSICNLLAAIKTAKQLSLGDDDVILTVATDGYELYLSEHERFLAERHGGEFDTVAAAEIVARHLEAADTSHTIELDRVGRDRIFNLGYFTWVEQQGVSLADFEARRSQAFWRGLHQLAPAWDEMIREFNGRTGVLNAG